MPVQTGPLQLRRLTSAQRVLVTPAAGEPIYDKTLKRLFMGDGVTLGGIAVAPTDSPPLTGTPTTPTAATDTNTTQIASTAFVLGQAGNSLPLVDSTAAVGTSLRYSRMDHVHPTDATRAPLASPALTGVPTAPTASPGTNTTQLATTAFVEAARVILAAADALKLNAANPSSTGLFTLGGGQLAFPAVQNPSADANTLDDYEEGTWTPTLTFATPGNLAVTYGTRLGSYTKIGREVILRFHIATSAFTWTTASGLLQISGLPFTASAVQGSRGSLEWSGVTKASYTQLTTIVGTGAAVITVNGSGSGVGSSNVVATDLPSGGTVLLIGTITYMV